MNLPFYKIRLSMTRVVPIVQYSARLLNGHFSDPFFMFDAWHFSDQGA
jgi:hypothetical protein